MVAKGCPLNFHPVYAFFKILYLFSISFYFYFCFLFYFVLRPDQFNFREHGFFSKF